MALKKFYLEHKGVSIGFVFSIIVILFCLLTLGKEEILEGSEKWLNVLFQVGVGYIINFLFYITQVYLPQIKEEEKAFSLFERDLEKLAVSMSRLNNMVKAFVDFKDDKIDYKRGVIYFTNDLDNKFNFYRVNIDEDIKNSCRKIVETTNRIINNKVFNFCSKELIYCVSEIQANDFIKSISTYACYPDTMFKILKCRGIENLYKEFVSLYEELLKYGYYDNEVAYRELTEEELKECIPEWEEKRQKIKDYMASANAAQVEGLK